MKRKGIYKPTIEDMVELAGIETLHPGGFALTQRTAELANLKQGLKVLDVSSGRGTQSVYYAKEFGVNITGIDIDQHMIQTASELARKENMQNQVTFEQGDSQNLPFDDNTFDAVINECAVGIPDDSQKVLNEMVRVTKPGGYVVFHEPTWKTKLSDEKKEEFSERYGTTPLELQEWITMFEKAGVKDIIYEFEAWSKPEMYWKIRKNRDVKHWFFTMTVREKIRTMIRILKEYGIKGIFMALKNEQVFYKKMILGGALGYALFEGKK